MLLIDGNDGTGKTTLVNIIREYFPHVDIKDRGFLTKLTDIHPDNHKLPEKIPVSIILDATIDICSERIYKRKLFNEKRKNNNRYILLILVSFLVILLLKKSFIEKNTISLVNNIILLSTVTYISVHSLLQLYYKHNNHYTCDYYDTKEALFKYRNRFRRLAVQYNIPIIDTTHVKISDYYKIAKEIMEYYYSEKFNNAEYKYLTKLPNPNEYSEEDFNKLETLAEGHSKIVKIIDDKYTIIKMKPTVHSHTHQRAGIVEGTDKARMDSTREILYFIDNVMIPHAYIFVGDNYILCERLSLKYDIPPVEVIVKNCYVGTDKHRYFGLKDFKTRKGINIVNVDKKNKYSGYVCRFDYRNPNHYPEGHEKAGEPLGDYVMCDDLANEFINVKKSKELAFDTFEYLEILFERMGIFLEDICFMITTDGNKHYYEISPDCGRFKKLNDNDDSLDKDVWRAGGSSELVGKKWRMLADIIKKYSLKVYHEKNVF